MCSLRLRNAALTTSIPVERHCVNRSATCDFLDDHSPARNDYVTVGWLTSTLHRHSLDRFTMHSATRGAVKTRITVSRAHHSKLKIGDRLRDSALGRSSFLDLVREEPGAALSIAALSASRWRAHNSR
jgi:hypothetical protein